MSKSIIFNTELASLEVKEHFSRSISLLREIVDYGIDLVLRGYMTSNRGIPDFIVFNVFLKNIVIQADGVLILLDKGAGEASKSNLRVIFETEVMLEWILKAETDKKARAFYVFNLLDEKEYRNKIALCPEGRKELERVYERIEEKYGKNLFIERAKKIECLLRNDFKDIVEEYDSCRNKNNWYCIFKKSNFFEIAEDIGLAYEYKVFYRSLSKGVHTTSTHSFFIMGEDEEYAKQIRGLEDIDFVLTMSRWWLLRIYRLLLVKYREGEVEKFDEKCRTKWRDDFQSIKAI
jgi:hypothetical protein